MYQYLWVYLGVLCQVWLTFFGFLLVGFLWVVVLLCGTVVRFGWLFWGFLCDVGHSDAFFAAKLHTI